VDGVERFIGFTGIAGYDKNLGHGSNLYPPERAAHPWLCVCCGGRSSLHLSQPDRPRSSLKGQGTILDVGLDDYKVVLYRNQPDGWVAEVPAIPGCYALMPTREGALAELAAVFGMISEEYARRDQPLPDDTTEIVHA